MKHFAVVVIVADIDKLILNVMWKYKRSKQPKQLLAVKRAELEDSDYFIPRLTIKLQ